MRKPLNTSVPEELILKIDGAVKASKGSYRDRSHLVEQAINLYLAEDGPSSRKTGSLQYIIPTISLYETSLVPRLSINLPEKRAIAGRAAEMIETGKTLFIDGSTTCLELARVLAHQKKDLTIVTNSTLICMELGHGGGNHIIGIGGDFDPSSACFTGRDCEEAAVRFYMDYAFFSTKGFFPVEGTFESNVATLRVKQVVAQHVAKVVLLVDHTKFNQRSLLKVLDISQINVIVTSEQAPTEAVQMLQAGGHEVKIAQIESTAQGEI